MEIRKVEKKNLVDEVYKQIKMMIVSGKWKEGTRLGAENELGKEFSVSRVVIREALQRLRIEKLIVTRQGLGSFVSNPYNFIPTNYHDLDGSKINLNERDFNDFLEFRRCFEYPSIKLFVIRATEEDLQQIQDSVIKMEQSNGNISDYTDADYMFHYAIVSGTHNPYLIRAMSCCQDIIWHALYEMNKLPDCHPWGVEMHSKILDCLRQRDAKAAIALLNEKTNYNYARLSHFFTQEDQNMKQDKDSGVL